jgi:hypothetical protein
MERLFNHKRGKNGGYRNIQFSPDIKHQDLHTSVKGCLKNSSEKRIRREEEE